MPKYICSKIISYLKKNKNKNKKCLLLGVAYKKNVDDMRESPSLKIIEILEKNKIHCDFYDPYIKKIGKLRNFKRNKFSIKLNKNILSSYEAVIIATDHDNINYKLVRENSKMIFDCRGRFSNSNYNNVEQI